MAKETKTRLTVRHDLQPGILEGELYKELEIPVDVEADPEDRRKEIWRVNPSNQEQVFQWLMGKGVQVLAMQHAPQEGRRL